MQTRLAKTLPVHPTLTLHGQPVRALGRSKSGRLIWPVHGGAPENDPPDDEKKFTQADLDRMTAEARSRGERTGKQQGQLEGFAKFLDDAGLPADTKPEAVKQALAEKRAAELKDLTEAERKIAEANDRAAAAEAQVQAAKDREQQRERELFEERVSRLIGDAGVGAHLKQDKDKQAEAVADVRRMLDVKPGEDSEDVKKKIEALKERHPALFPDENDDETQQQPGGGLPDGRPGARPGTQRTQAKSRVAEGREIAVQKGWKKPEPAAS